MNPFLNTTHRNALWFKTVHDRNELDMKPPFQRNPVWVTRQKSFLIDSILNGFPIPEIYMQELVTPQGESKHTIVDGQQRIRAVLEFLEDRFAMDSKDSPAWGDMFFDDLSEDDKRKIFSYNFVVRLLPEIDDIQIRSIFQRLNRNVVALNKQELRQATYWGVFLNLVNNLSNLEIWQDVNVFSQNDIRRMLDVEFISELTVALLNGPQNKKDKLDDYYQIYEENFEKEQYVDEVFRTVLKEIVKTIPEISKTRWRKKTDFYTLFLFFARNYEKLPLDKKHKEIARDLLLVFGKELDKFVKVSEDKSDDFSDPVKKYGIGIRASTDLGSRKRRDEGLELVLISIWE